MTDGISCQGSTASRCKNMEKTGSSQKNMNMFFWGRKIQNSFKVVIQGYSQQWVYSGFVCYSIDILGNGNLKIIQESLMVDLLQLNTRIVLFKYSDFNHQTI